ncbi:MAG: hypothetical protein H8D46_04565 [FCB group bacterium]|nr:hypothetical protein [FCB group bacterium]
MSSNKRTPILAVFLIIVIGYFLIDSGIIPLGAQPLAEAESASAKAQITAAAITPNIICDYERLNKLNEKHADVKWDKDPFFYLGNSRGGTNPLFGGRRNSGMDLTGISCITNTCSAVINSEIVKEGDSISGHTVKKIEMKYVLLDRGGNTIRLMLNE